MDGQTVRPNGRRPTWPNGCTTRHKQGHSLVIYCPGSGAEMSAHKITVRELIAALKLMPQDAYAVTLSPSADAEELRVEGNLEGPYEPTTILAREVRSGWFYPITKEEKDDPEYFGVSQVVLIGCRDLSWLEEEAEKD